MALLDRFRRRDPLESPEAEVRAEAVRHLSFQDQDRLARLAREDEDPRVRRAAVRRLRAPLVLREVATGDADEDVRREAAEALQGLARGEDPTAAEAALAGLADSRALQAVARSSPLAPLRLAALGRISDPRALALIARTSEDPAVRRTALSRVEDVSLLAEVASKSEHKDTAVGAVERIDDAESLVALAGRARHKAASRRARAKLEALGPPPVSPGAGSPEEAAVLEAPDLPTALAAEPPEERPPADEDLPAPEADPPAPDAAAAVSRADGAPGASADPDVRDEGPEAPESSPTPTAAIVTEAAPPEAPAPAPEAAPAVAPAVDAARDEGREAATREAPTGHEDRKARVARVEALCGRLEGLAKAGSMARRDGEAALRDARSAQADLGGVPGRLQQRLREARAALFARVQELREADEWGRWGNATAQEELCRRMEALESAKDLDRAARELRDCDARWAQFRYAPKDEAGALRERYQAARSKVKARVDEYLAAKAQQEAENLKQKEALCVRAETLADSSDWLRTAEELKGLQARWKEAGPVPRAVSEALWRRFRGACDRFFTRREEDLKKRKQDWAVNLERKEALCGRAEALAASTDWDAALAEVKAVQAEWKNVGPVARKKSEAVWQRFRGACDAFFERYKRRDALTQEVRRVEKEALCHELEGLLPAAGEAAAEDLASRVQALQARLRQLPALAPEEEQGVARRFLEARNRLVAALPESFRGTDLDPEASRQRKEKLCARVEAFLASAAQRGEGDTSGSAEALARRLQAALAANAIGGGAEVEARRRAEVEEVQSAQAAWRRLGPVPGDAGEALEARFQSACTRFFEIRRSSGPVRRAAR